MEKINKENNSHAKGKLTLSVEFKTPNCIELSEEETEVMDSIKKLENKLIEVGTSTILRKEFKDSKRYMRFKDKIKTQILKPTVFFAGTGINLAASPNNFQFLLNEVLTNLIEYEAQCKESLKDNIQSYGHALPQVDYLVNIVRPICLEYKYFFTESMFQRVFRESTNERSNISDNMDSKNNFEEAEDFFDKILNQTIQKYLLCTFIKDGEKINENTINRLYSLEDEGECLAFFLMFISDFISYLAISETLQRGDDYFQDKFGDICNKLNNDLNETKEVCINLEKENKKLEDQNERLQKQVSALQNKIATQEETQKNKRNEDLKKLIKENQELERRLAKSERLYESSLEKIERFKSAVNDKEKIEDLQKNEQQQELNYDRRYIFVLNMPGDLKNTLKERFPNSEVVEANRISKEMIANSDALVINVNALPHSDYYKLKDDAQRTNIPIIHINSLNIDIIEEVIKAYA